MTIESLMRAVPPPEAPFEAFLGPWEPVEAELRTALPPDYKDFARLYGFGYFMEFLGISIPRSTNPNTRLESSVPNTCEMFGQFHDRDEFPYPIWPNPGGLVPFGGTDNGDELFWLPRGAPSNWGVVVWDRGLGNFEPFDCDMTDFLAGLATGALLPEEFPPLLPCEHLFLPDARYVRLRHKWKVSPGGSMGFP
jgi:hypothetical protein